VKEYVYPVGRLDYDSEGLLLMTSDGDLAARLTHPRHGVEREYEVRVRGVPDQHDVERLSKGISLEGRRTAPAAIELRKVIEGEHGSQALLSFVIREGRNRQVRDMCDAIGHPVVRLRRVRIGPIHDEHIRPGEFRDLTEREVAQLRRATGDQSVRVPGEQGARQRVREQHPRSESSATARGPRADGRPRRG
jgi:pseudouridine synthase